MFLPFIKFTKLKRKKKTKTKTPLWSLKTPLSEAKWLRLHDYCRGLRIGAVKGYVTEVMHQKGSSLTPCLIPDQSSASCLLRECMWPTVCRLLVFLRAPGLLCPLCIKAKLHFLSWLSLWLCMQLKWLFAPEVAVCIWQQGGRGTKLPALTFFVLPLDYSKGFGGKYGVQKDRMDKVSSFEEP